MDVVINWINSLVGGNTFVSSTLVSMIPLIELKGGILFARECSLNFLYGFLFPYLGSTIIFFPIFFLLKPILNLLKKIKFIKNFALKIESYFAAKAKKVRENGKQSFSESTIKFLGVLIFVAVPLPMTGVWTGTAVAVFLGLEFKKTLPAVIIGNLIAGLIISILAELFLPYVDIILNGLLILAVILLVIVIVKIALSKPQKDNEE